MNWDWVPWFGSSSDGSKDEGYEEQVIERCSHDWGSWQDLEQSHSMPMFGARSDHYTPVQVTEGHLVFPIYRHQARYCTNCGKQGQKRVRKVKKGAIALDYIMDPDVELSKALDKPSEEPGSIVVNNSEV